MPEEDFGYQPEVNGETLTDDIISELNEAIQ